MTLVEGDELQRLWALVSELSSQLASNREACASLQQQADDLKGQALHTGTGYTLRRFNLDISKEKFESDLEKINAQLVVENQALAHENKQMNHLLREYEQTLEAVMAKFRSFSHATQSHTLSLTSHYETLLANNTHDAADVTLQSSTALSNALAHLGGLVRVALRSVEGEEIGEHEGEEGIVEDAFEAEGYHIESPSGTEPSAHVSAVKRTGASDKAGSKAKVSYGSAPSADPKWHGTGGYTGLAGDPEVGIAERALETQTEEERIRFENQELREMLRVSADLTPETAKRFGIEMPPPPPPPGSMSLSLGKPRSQLKRSPSSSGAQQYQTHASGSGNSPSSSGEAGSPTAPFAPTHMTSGAGGPPQLQEGSPRTGTVASPELLERSSPTIRAVNQGQRQPVEEESDILPPSMIDEGPPPPSFVQQSATQPIEEEGDGHDAFGAVEQATVTPAIPEEDTSAGETEPLSEQSTEELKASMKSEEARVEQVRDSLGGGSEMAEHDERGEGEANGVQEQQHDEDDKAMHREKLLQETEEEIDKAQSPTPDEAEDVGEKTIMAMEEPSEEADEKETPEAAAAAAAAAATAIVVEGES